MDFKIEQEIIKDNKQKIKEKIKPMSDYIEDCFDIDRLVLILEMLEEEELFNIKVEDVIFDIKKDNYNFCIKSNGITLTTTRYGKISCQEIKTLEDYKHLEKIYNILKKDKELVYRKIKEQLENIIKNQQEILDF